MTRRRKNNVATNKYIKPVTSPSEPVQTNPYIGKAKSHHASVANLPGGDKYTKGRRVLKGFAGVIGIVFMVIVLITVALVLNFGSDGSLPDQPASNVAEAAFQKSTAPSLVNQKYLSDTKLSNPKVENVEIGKVVRNSGNGESGFSCEGKAVVTFSNASIEATSNMRVTMTYNSLLGSWSAGTPEIEMTNYKPTGHADTNLIQADLMNILGDYDKQSANDVQGGTITREGDLGNDGGLLTFKIEKYNTSGTTLTKTVKVRIAWSDIDGWTANVAWLGTSGEAEENTSDVQSDESAEATTEASYTSGETVELVGSVSGGVLTTPEVTKYVIDDVEITTSTINLSGDLSVYPDGTTGTITGTISTDGNSITLTIGENPTGAVDIGVEPTE